MAERPAGFTPLSSLRKGPPDAAAALAAIRQIYFGTSQKTIEHDFAHAIELLKSLPTEDERAKAHVYMEGLAEMMREWQRSGRSGTSGKSGRSGKVRDKGKGQRGRE